MNQNLAIIGSPAVAGDGANDCATNFVSKLRSENLRLKYAATEIRLENDLRKMARKGGSYSPSAHQWPRTANGSLEIPTLRSLQWNVSALRFQLALFQVAYRGRKGGSFDPNEPRVPAGQSGAGEWTDGGGNAAGANPTGAPEGSQGPLKVTIYVPLRTDEGGDSNGEPTDSPGGPPEIPVQAPDSSGALYDFAKEVAWWAAKALAKEAANPVVGTLLNALEAVYWGYRAYPYVKAYLDPPKLLGELQRATSSPAKGYDIHHVVERASARDAKYPKHMINAPENLVRIPTLKHWQVTGWYMRANNEFKGLSPREYLRDKNWAERTRVGREALIEFKVLKP